MGGGKGGGKIQIVRYYMTVHHAICHGPVERLRKIVIKEKTAWEGAVGDQTTLSLGNLDLFGGDKKEGGIEGTVHYQPGNWTQTVDAPLAERFGKTPTTMPGYRGIATAGFRKRTDMPREGFYWTANTPYIPPAAFEVSRIPRDWQPGLAGVPREGVNWFLTEWDTIRQLSAAFKYGGEMAPGVNEIYWNDPFILDLRVKTAWFPDKPYLVDDENMPYIGGTPDVNLRTASGGIEQGVEFFVGRGPYDVDELPPRETSWCYTSGPGDRMVVELYAAPGRFFLFDITWVDPSNRQITLVNQNQMIFQADAEYTGWELSEPYGPYPDSGGGDYDADARRDMNPAHIIRECMVDQVWGLGLPTSLIDDDAFRTAAQTLFDETFGLSMLWVRQTKTQDFVAEVLDHINGLLYPDPRTGKFVLRLIRDDYDPDTLPVIDPSNADLRNFSRRSPSEVINEIQVTWTNPENEEESVVVLQDLGAIVAANGEITSDARNYYGVRYKALAARLAARDIATATAPLATAEAQVDRRAWAYTPGDVVKLTWPEYGADELVMRVMRVDYGRPGDSKVTLSMTEDIFGYQNMEPVEPDDTEAQAFGSTAETPDPVEFLTTPLWFVRQDGADLPGDDEAYVAVLPRTTVFDTISAETESLGSSAMGASEWQEVGELDVVAAALTAEDWAAEAETVTTTGFTAYSAGDGPETGGLAILGADGLAEAAHEIVAFTAVDESGDWTVQRGCLDTVPREWPSGTTIRFLSLDAAVADPDSRAVGIEIDYRLRTRTSLGLLSTLDAALPSYTPTDRVHAPARPANAKVRGTGFGLADGTGGGDITVTWSNRNRLTEETVLLAWDAATVTPEAGQTTTLTLLDDSDDSTISAITGLSGTTHDIPFASFGGADYGRVRFEAVRDGITSIQGHEVRVKLTSGYGFAYGDSYGE